jgi:hypothetical protein
MYLAGVSVRRVEDITEALWGTRVSPSTVSNLNKKIYGTIEAWRNRPIDGEHPYVYLDGIVLTRSWAGEVRNVSLLVAIGVNGEGYREILGICEGAKEDKAGWSGFLKHLKGRGLHGVRLIISDACMGLSESAAEFFPEAAWQRCIVHWYRNIFSHVPSTKVREIAAMLKAIHAGEDMVAARQKAVQVIEKLRALRLTNAAELVATAVEETLAYYAFPQEHWRRIRTTDEIDKTVFVNWGDATWSILLFGRPTGHSSVPAVDLGAAARRGGQGWPRLRPPQGLALTGPSTAVRSRGRAAFLASLELAITGDYACWARATSRRSVARRLQASPDGPIMSCRAEAPARRLLAAAASIAPRSARNCAPLGRQAASRGLAAP